ncbi:hypothetical protein ACFV4F_06485 [Kitasatospora sp. NPDC059722]|uniref:hypothetical protein n=1 Tax=Kitasatospora sp. NPDC059722 TaxID=3346925 RepID=UPI00368D9D41
MISLFLEPGRDLGDLLVAAAVLAHLDVPVAPPPGEAPLPGWLGAAGPAGDDRPRAALAVGGPGAAATALASGLPLVAVLADPDLGAALAAECGGRVVVCTPAAPRITSSAASGRGVKTVGPFLPYRRTAARGSGVVLIADALGPAQETLLAHAQETGVAVGTVHPWRDDVLRAIAGAAVVCGPDGTELRDAASLWGRFAVLAPGTGPSDADPAGLPPAERRFLTRLAAEPAVAVAAPGGEQARHWPGGGPRVARQLRQALLAPF